MSTIAQAHWDQALADERPKLPRPLEQAAVAGSYVTRNAECRECGHPLTEREYAEDGEIDGDGYRFCGRNTCRDCEGEQ